MTIQVDARNHVVRVDDVVDLAAAHAVREAVLAMEGDVAIDFRDARRGRFSAPAPRHDAFHCGA